MRVGINSVIISTLKSKKIGKLLILDSHQWIICWGFSESAYVRTSDPYVVIKMAKQKLKTRVIHKNVNPEWNEDLTLSVSDPSLPVFLIVYDYDTFSMDDRMGDAEFDIRPFIEAVKMKLEGLPNNTIITKTQPSRSNCLSEENCVVWKDGRLAQHMCLRLKNVECGEVEIELQWIHVPGSSRGI